MAKIRNLTAIFFLIGMAAAIFGVRSTCGDGLSQFGIPANSPPTTAQSGNTGNQNPPSPQQGFQPPAQNSTPAQQPQPAPAPQIIMLNPPNALKNAMNNPDQGTMIIPNIRFNQLLIGPSGSNVIINGDQVYDDKGRPKQALSDDPWADFPSRLSAISTDGKYAAFVMSGGQAGAGDVAIYSLGSGKNIANVQTNGSPLKMAFTTSDNLETINRAPRSCMVQVWNVNTGEPIRQFVLPTFFPPDGLSPDGRYVFVPGNDLSGEHETLYDLQQGTLVAHLSLPPAATGGNLMAEKEFAFSPNGATMARLYHDSSGDEILSIWNGNGQGKTIVLPSLVSEFDSLELLSQGNYALVGKELVDLQSGLPLWICTAQLFGNASFTVVDNNTLLVEAIHGVDGLALIKINVPWDKINGLIKEMNSGAPCLLGKGTRVRVEFSPDFSAEMTSAALADLQQAVQRRINSLDFTYDPKASLVVQLDMQKNNVQRHMGWVWDTPPGTPGTVPKGHWIQQSGTEFLWVASLVDKTNNRVLWPTSNDANAGIINEIFIDSQAPSQAITLHEAVFKEKLENLALPYFISSDPGHPGLPLESAD